MLEIAVIRDNPMFNVRVLDDESGYVIDAVWPDGKTEQLVGVYAAPRFAAEWVRDRSAAWFKARLPPDVIELRPLN